jgi:hypothetical protein
MLTTHPLAVPRLRKSGSYTSSHPKRQPPMARSGITLSLIYISILNFEKTEENTNECER